MNRIAAVAVLAATPSLALAAAAEPAAGERIRARVHGSRRTEDWVVGRLLDADGASVTIRTATGEAVSLPLRRLDRVERSLGSRGRGRGALRAAGRGFVGGAVLGGLGGAVGERRSFPVREDAALGAAVLGVAGAVVGGLVGSLAPGERWERMSVGP
jgi:hypothetical protein